MVRSIFKQFSYIRSRVMDTTKSNEKSRQMPGHIEEEVDEETGKKRDFWKKFADKIHFRKFDEVGQMLTKEPLAKLPLAKCCAAALA